MKIDKTREYGKIKSLDPKNKTAFTQDGIEYDRAGESLKQKQVTAYLDGQAAAIQAEADAAMEKAKEVKAEAKERLAELKERK